jgi:hypothetical protein
MRPPFPIVETLQLADSLVCRELLAKGGLIMSLLYAIFVFSGVKPLIKAIAA